MSKSPQGKAAQGKAAILSAANLPLLIGLVLILALALAVYFYFQYAQTAGHLPLASAASQVSIGSPANGAELVAFVPLTIDALAAGPMPFTSMELWINGVLVSVQSGPSGGKTPLSASFAWLPKEEGSFSLVARAINADGQTSTSDPVQVTIIPNQDLAQGFSEQFADVPAVAPALGGGGYSPPSGPSSGDSSGPSDDWSPDPGDWINGSSDDPPAAPELVAIGDAAVCQADLSIHDLSNNEEGFAVFFQINGGNWLQIKTLSAQSQFDWIELNDVHLIGGQNSFYVSSFNSQGEAQSNLVMLYMDPADCVIDLVQPVEQEEILFVNIDVLSLLTETVPDKLYCYRSVNGGPFSRWPAVDYFYPDQNGAFTLDEVLQVVSSQLDPLVQFPVYLECWGWFGDNLEYLGNVSNEEANFSLGGAVITNGGLQVSLVFETLEGDWSGFDFGLIDDFAANYQIGAINKTLKYLFPPDMVSPAAFVTYDSDECTNHLPPEAQNLLGTLVFCFPYPGFHGGFAEGDNPQPYLVWNFYKTCALGYGTEQEGGPCHSYDYWRQLAADNNGKVGFFVYDYSNAGEHTWVIEADQLRMLNIPPNGCTGPRTFYVQMWYEEGGFKQYSQWSNPYTIDCPKPVGDVLEIAFTFDTLTLNNQDDGDSGTQTVELFGYFQVQAPSSQLGNNNFLKMGAWDEQWSECPDDTDYFTSNPPGSCTQRLTNGSHNLANIPLCKSSNYAQDDKYHCTQQITSNYTVQDSYNTSNNTLRVEVTDGDGVRIWVVLHDWDDASANDLVCWGYADIDSKSIFEWDAMDGAGFGVIAFGDVNSGGTCNISGHIEVN